MSDTDDSVVLVDTPSAMVTEPELILEQAAALKLKSTKKPGALQIVSIGSEDDKYAFQFHYPLLQSILAKVPSGSKVAIVSVVGAFRTGKSFLLSWFLRYLSSKTSIDSTEDETEWYKKFQSVGNDGFDWRAGAERNTTGLWMWSEPFLMDDKAILLIDTQGMFDHETTMALTASIFGFSTLLSSYQIYNVDKRIQEDNLQQLALFSEYARMAVGIGDEATVGTIAATLKPFQHIEFLVRDWQNFEEDDEEDYDSMEASMEEYLNRVIADRDAKDLQDTREQIQSCFAEISCYGLVHPGATVTKKKYTGDVTAMDETFLNLLVRYCDRVFGAALQPKVIHGRALTAEQFGVYVAAYAELFASGASFPAAGTMLEATAKANNTNAVHMAVNNFKECMNRVAGPQCTNYLRPEELKEEHLKSRKSSLTVFDAMANFGNKKSIEEARAEVGMEMDAAFEFYESLNAGRNPLAGFELYVFPVFVALVSYFARALTDATCSATVCRATSEVLSHIYVVVFLFLGIVAATKTKQIADALGRAQHVLTAMTNDKNKKD